MYGRYEILGTFGRELHQTEGSGSGEASGGQRGVDLRHLDLGGQGIILRSDEIDKDRIGSYRSADLMKNS
jgi:hypothetical protein